MNSHAPESEAIAKGSGLIDPIFFPVSVTKLIVLTVCTLGLYELFWFYKNWCLIRAREESDIWPFWRTIFGYFFCYEMFTRVRDQQTLFGDSPQLPAGPLAAGWIIVNLLWRLPDPYWLVCFLAVMFVVPVQVVASRINAAVTPNYNRNAKFTPLNWITVAVGGAVFVLAVVGSFLPETGS